MSENIEDLTDKLESLGLKSESKLIKIILNEKILICESSILKEKSKYFEAFLNFDPTQEEIEIKGGIEEDASQIIIEYFNGADLNLNLENFQDVLQGAIFLQCSCVESKTIAYIATQLGLENVFRILEFSTRIGSRKLGNTAKYYIESVFSVFLNLATKTGKVEEFLDLKIEDVLSTLDTDIQCGEDLLCFAAIGWIEHIQERCQHFVQIFSKLTIALLSQSCLEHLQEDKDLQVHLEAWSKQIELSLKYLGQPVDSTVRRLSELEKYQGFNARWPKIIIACTVGNLKGQIHYLDLRSDKSHVWKVLTRKPKVLVENSTGSSMVYLHPRLFFFGGERRWRVSWFDLENNSWGESEGVPPPRLLSGAVSLQDRIYLIGGVSVEEWERGSRELVTSSSVDTFQPSSCTWSQSKPLPQGISNPAVAVLKDEIYLFGGLNKRRIIQDCYRLTRTGWEELPSLPAQFCYPALVVDEGRGGIWLIGGMDGRYITRTETYFYLPESRTWKLGPNLNRHRKSGFGFEYNGDVYVYGGSTDGLKNVDTTEVLKMGADSWEISKKNTRNWHSTVTSVKAKLPGRLLPYHS